MSDLISRKAVMECFEKYHYRMATRVLEFQGDENGNVIGYKDADTGVPYLFEKVGGPHD